MKIELPLSDDCLLTVNNQKMTECRKRELLHEKSNSLTLTTYNATYFVADVPFHSTKNITISSCSTVLFQQLNMIREQPIFSQAYEENFDNMYICDSTYIFSISSTEHCTTQELAENSSLSSCEQQYYLHHLCYYAEIEENRMIPVKKE